MAIPREMRGPGMETVAKTVKSDKYGGVGPTEVKTEEPSISKEPFEGDEDAPEDPMEKAGHPETVKNAYKMAKKLRETAKQNSEDPKMEDAVGGLGNILGALQGVAAMKQQAQQNRQNAQKIKKDIMESLLRKYYTQATGKDPLDLFGHETPDYKTWRTQYLQINNLNDVYDVPST